VYFVSVQDVYFQVSFGSVQVVYSLLDQGVQSLAPGFQIYFLTLNLRAPAILIQSLPCSTCAGCKHSLYGRCLKTLALPEISTLTKDAISNRTSKWGRDDRRRRSRFPRVITLTNLQWESESRVVVPEWTAVLTQRARPAPARLAGRPFSSLQVSFVSKRSSESPSSYST
jgi:hypothetical protein